jgi:hypothetical protein
VSSNGEGTERQSDDVPRLEIRTNERALRLEPWNDHSSIWRSYMYSNRSSKIYTVKKIMSGSVLFWEVGPKSADLPRHYISDPRQSRG